MNCAFRFGLAGLVFFVAIPQTVLSQSSANGLRTVVLSGEIVPGADDASTFRNFFQVAIDSRGELTFIADLADTNGVRLTVPKELDPVRDDIAKTSDMGIWRETSENLSLIMRQGREIPGTSDGSIGWLIDPLDNDDEFYNFRVSDHTLLATALVSDNVDDLANSGVEQGVWQFDRESTRVIATGSNGLDGSERFHADLGDMNNNGMFLIAARTIPLGNVNDHKHSLWVSTADGELNLLARDDAPAPGLVDGISLRQPGQLAAINGRGQVAFASQTSLRDDVVDARPRFVNGVWSVSGDEDFQLLALTNADDSSLRIPSGDIGHVDVNAHGDVAFSLPTSVWKYGNTSGLQQIASYDQTVNLGESTGSLRFQDVYVSDDGTVSFRAAFWDDEGNGSHWPTTLWKERDGGVIPIAFPGQHLETFDGAELLAVRGSMQNALGQTVFGGIVAESAEDGSFEAVLAEDLNGRLHSIVRTGELLEVLPGDFREVQYTGVEGINERGQLAIKLDFTDGSEGLFVSNLVTVPEPDAMVTLLFSTMLLFRSHRPGGVVIS